MTTITANAATAAPSTVMAWDRSGPLPIALADLGHSIMRRLRRAAVLMLDMRTEFEILAPGEVSDPAGRPGRPEGPMAGPGRAIMARARRAASKILDPWTEFDALD